ncbi:DUF6916 family protein [Agrobacterium sp. rho-13.3]|uniref:DUF6916 family protein n=1 Tax=Agrobacterium sp. rho-13.3 TaxID=3072980 RepID=UPI002A0F5419|nr:hypothetical protein [Agrobacterium sp. rho-13.3]MDX8308532.1 hypothetical protein [Agrobacterium sp. rho-13.3]
MDIQLLSADIFLPHMGSDFSLLSDGEVFMTLTLADCRMYPRGTKPGTARTAFTMLLEAPESHVPLGNHGSFIIRHEVLGEFGPVHVGRVISTRPDVAVLEIIFN